MRSMTKPEYVAAQIRHVSVSCPRAIVVRATATSKEVAEQVAKFLNEGQYPFEAYKGWVRKPYEVSREVDGLERWCVVDRLYVVHYESRYLQKVSPPPVEWVVTEVPKLYDGLTAGQCLDFFIKSQQDGKIPRKSRPLSDAQKAAARELWSTQLRAKVQETKHKERHQVVVDRDFEEWE